MVRVYPGQLCSVCDLMLHLFCFLAYTVTVFDGHSKEKRFVFVLVFFGIVLHIMYITTTTPTIPYYTINLKHLSYCRMPDLENQEWWVKKLFDMCVIQ